MKKLLYLTGILLFTVTTVYAQDCDSNEDARRYLVRAKAAFNEAKSDADFLNVVEEYKKALQFAPDCIDIYYNIAACYDKSATTGLLKNIISYAQAMKYFKKYLELNHNAPNKQMVQNRIYELEYKYDKLHKFIGKYGNIKYKIPTDYYFVNSVKDFEFEIKLSENNSKLIVVMPTNNIKTAYDTLEVKQTGKVGDVGAGNGKNDAGEEQFYFFSKKYRHYDYDEKKNSYKTKDYSEFDFIFVLKRANYDFEIFTLLIVNFCQYKNDIKVKGISDRWVTNDGLSIKKIE